MYPLNEETNVLLEEYEGAGEYLRIVAGSGLMSGRLSTLNAQRRDSIRESITSRGRPSVFGSGIIAIRDKTRDFDKVLKMAIDFGSSLRQRDD